MNLSSNLRLIITCWVTFSYLPGIFPFLIACQSIIMKVKKIIDKTPSKRPVNVQGLGLIIFCIPAVSTTAVT